MSQWQISPEVLSGKLDEQVVWLNPDTKEYFDLNPMAELLLGELHSPQDIERLTAVVCGRYLVPREEAKKDITELLEEMRAIGLVQYHG